MCPAGQSFDELALRLRDEPGVLRLGVARVIRRCAPAMAAAPSRQPRTNPPPPIRKRLHTIQPQTEWGS